MLLKGCRIAVKSPVKAPSNSPKRGGRKALLLCRTCNGKPEQKLMVVQLLIAPILNVQNLFQNFL